MPEAVRDVIPAPEAASPADALALLASAVSLGDLEAAAGLYAADAVLVGEATGAPSLSVADQLAVLSALRLPLHVRVVDVVHVGELALVLAEWSMVGTGPAGAPVALGGTRATVLRHEGGRWRLLLDHPHAERARIAPIHDALGHADT